MKRLLLIAAPLMWLAASVAVAADAVPARKTAPVVAPAGQAAPAPTTKSPLAKKSALAAEPEAPVIPVTGMSAAQIVDKNVAARGGLAAWRAVNSLTLTGQLDAGGKTNVQLPFVMTLKRPHKSRMEIRFQDQAAVQVYDGTQGWKVRPFLNRNEVEAFTPAEAKLAAAASELDGPLVDYAGKGTKVELLGSQAVEGKSAYKLLVTLKDGTQRNLWVDAKSFLELKVDGDPKKMDGKVRKVAIFYRDYKTEKGLTVPYTQETVVEGIKITRKMTIQSVAVNTAQDDALFAKPHLAIAKAPAQ